MRTGICIPLFRKRRPAAASKFRVVMGAIHALAYEPADRAAHQHVGGKMVLARDAGRAHRRRQSIDQQFRQRARVFVSDHAGHGPCGGGMVGGKRRSAIPESSRAIASLRALPSKCEPENRRYR